MIDYYIISERVHDGAIQYNLKSLYLKKKKKKNLE